MPKGLLLEGPPGTGKTLLAKAIAGEANVPFFYISGSQFVEVYVGTGAARVRSLFEEAKKTNPSIIFIDEIDAVGRSRDSATDNTEQEQTLNQLLTEMDGFNTSGGTLVIAATNRIDMLDGALTRAGRFDRKITVPLPSMEGRKEILQIHLKEIRHNLTEEQINTVAQATLGYSGAELANLVNEAALNAVSKKKSTTDISDLESMHDRAIMGGEVRSLKMSEEDKINTAYHESGHTLAAALLKGNDPLHKVTILPRGQSLGHTAILPVNDKVGITHQQLLDQLGMLLGGRIAEEIAFGKENITTGASSDLTRATELVRGMVTQWGFSDNLGTVVYGGRGNAPSAETAAKIDREVHNIISTAYEQTKQLLTDNLDKLERLKDALLEHETLNAEQIHALIQ